MTAQDLYQLPEDEIRRLAREQTGRGGYTEQARAAQKFLYERYYWPAKRRPGWHQCGPGSRCTKSGTRSGASYDTGARGGQD